MVVPIQEEQEVYILFTVPNEPVYVLGSIYHPTYEKVQQFTPYVPIEEELNSFSKNDYFVSNNGNSINITSANGLIFQSESNIRLGLGEESKLRISKDGKSGELLLGGTQFLLERKKYIDELDAKIVKMEEVLTSLTAAVGAMHTAITGIGNTGNTPVVGTTMAPVAANSLADMTNAQSGITELTGLPKRTTVEHTKDCAKAINFNILIPKNEDE